MREGLAAALMVGIPEPYLRGEVRTLAEEGARVGGRTPLLRMITLDRGLAFAQCQVHTSMSLDRCIHHWLSQNLAGASVCRVLTTPRVGPEGISPCKQGVVAILVESNNAEPLSVVPGADRHLGVPAFAFLLLRDHVRASHSAAARRAATSSLSRHRPAPC